MSGRRDMILGFGIYRRSEEREGWMRWERGRWMIHKRCGSMDNKRKEKLVCRWVMIGAD